MQIHVHIFSNSLSFTLFPLEIDHAEETAERVGLKRQLIFAGKLVIIYRLNYFLLHVVPVFLVIDKSFGYIQWRSRVLRQHELRRSKKLDLAVFIHHVIQSLVA